MKKNKKKNLFGLVLATFIFSLFFLTWKLNIFTIKSETFTPDNLNCIDLQKLKDSTNLIGQNIFLVNFKKIEANLKNKFLCIGTITLSKQFPDKIKVFLEERKPAAVLSESNNKASDSATLTQLIESSASAKLNYINPTNKSYLVDSLGVVYSEGFKDSIPIIYIDNQNLNLGHTVSSDLMNMLIILDKIKIYGVNVTQANVIQGILIIQTSPKLIFKLEKDPGSQTASLQLILEKAKIDSSKLEFIDLRFDKPIIRIAPKKNG